MIKACARRLRADERGAVAVIFAFVLIPMVLFAGVAIDYTRFASAKAKLDAAADAAVLAATSNSTNTASAEAARKIAQDLFSSLADNARPLDVDGLTVTVSDKGVDRTAQLSYTARMRTSLGGVMGMEWMTANGYATSAQSRAPYIDFYLVLDNSPSMGVGATTADIAKMVANTSDKCAFACHDMSNANNYYDLAKKLGVTTRIDVLRSATQSLMDTAASLAAMPNQFRIGIYDFGADAANAKLTEITPLTPILANAKAKAGTIDLMTVPYQNYNNDMLTPLTAIMQAANQTISDPGDGSGPSMPQKVMFLVSDGVADEYNPTGCSRPTAGGGRCQAPITVSQCDAIKARGVRIAVLYTTYLPLPTNGWYNAWLAPFAGAISPRMSACASPGLFFEVSPSQGIAEAMAALFKQAVVVARLTK